MKGEYPDDDFTENEVLACLEAAGLKYKRGGRMILFIPVKNTLLSAMVDFDREDLLMQSWYIHSRGYVYNRKGELMHHFVMGKPPKGKVTDHINGNKFDNRRENLRFCTVSQNQKNRGVNKNNTSGYPGVNLVYGCRWYASIWHENKKIHLGTYETFKEAVGARKKAEVAYDAKLRA